MFCRAKTGVLTLLLGSSILALVAMIADYWITVPLPTGVLHIGLFRGCDEQQNCFTVLGTESTKDLLLSVFIIGILTLPCGILEVRYSMQGSLGCLMYVGVISSVLAILGFAAMVNGAVNLRPDQPFSYSWAFALGWISVIMAVTSAALSVYVSRVEPAAPLPEPQAEAGTATGTQTSSNPPGGVISPINRFIQMLSRKPTPPPS